MTEQEQYTHLAAGFAKLDNDRRNSLDDYTQQLVQAHLQDTGAVLCEREQRITAGNYYLRYTWL